MFSDTPYFFAVSKSRIRKLGPELTSRRCPEQPAIEITRLVDIDMVTGEVNLPANLR